MRVWVATPRQGKEGEAIALWCWVLLYHFDHTICLPNPAPPKDAEILQL